MIITAEEVDHLQDFVDYQRRDYRNRSEMDLKSVRRMQQSWAYFALRPHLLLALDFDECVSALSYPAFNDDWFEPLVREGGSRIGMYAREVYQTWGAETLYLYHHKTVRRWYLLSGTPAPPHDQFVFVGQPDRPKEPRVRRIDFDKFLPHLKGAARVGIGDEQTIWSRKLWTPDAAEREGIGVVHGVRLILAAIKDQKLSLGDVRWQELEDIVEELFRSSGAKVERVKKRPQGGRDLIVRGEFYPGSPPVLMAVEVKHEKVVGIGEVREGLWANKGYPALMFCTSGRYSAGVLEEQAKEDNRLRLILKDGVALGDWIKNYKLAR